jgi:type IV pilus assembly protein PilF
MTMTRPPFRRCLPFALAVAVLLLSACASKEPTAPAREPEPPPPVKQQEVSPQRRAELHTDLAAGYYERGQMDVALNELNEAVKLEPNNAKAYNIYGLVYTVLGENAKAEQNFRRALTLAPQDSETRQNWGWYLCTHERVKESIPEFEQAVSNPLYKTPEIPLINGGRCSMMIGDAKAAEGFFQRALAVAPGNEPAAYGLALLAFRAGRYDDARRWMKAIRQTNLPPEALYLGMCVERKLGDRQAETSYTAQLRNRYPDSAEAKALARGACE